MLALLLASVVASADGSAAQTAPAQPPPSAQSAPAKPAANDPDKIVCSKEDIPGTRMSRRVCRTQAQIDAAAQAAQRFFRDSNDQGARQASAPSTMGTGLPGG